MGALLLALVAAMTPFVADPDIAYAQSADATLDTLTIVVNPVMWTRVWHAQMVPRVVLMPQAQW